MPNSCGALYIATGDKYIQEAIKSVQSLASHMPDLHTTIVTDDDDDVTGEYFDNVIVLDNPSYHYGDSLHGLKKTPYDQTLYLDSDTYICSDIRELFTLLEQFDVALCQNPTRRGELSDNSDAYSPEEIPDSFPQFNTGVIIFKSNENWRSLLDNWEHIYKNNLDHGILNQPAFRKASYKSNCRIATLPPEYNCFVTRPGYVHGSVKILHGRHPRIENISERLNSSTSKRVHTTKRWPIQVLNESNGLHFRLGWFVSKIIDKLKS